MGNILHKEEIVHEPFVCITSKTPNNTFNVKYRYPNGKINIKEMKYKKIMKLAKKLKVPIDAE